MCLTQIILWTFQGLDLLPSEGSPSSENGWGANQESSPGRTTWKSVTFLAQLHFLFSFHLTGFADGALGPLVSMACLLGGFLPAPSTPFVDGFASIQRWELARALSDTPRYHAYDELCNYLHYTLKADKIHEGCSKNHGVCPLPRTLRCHQDVCPEAWLWISFSILRVLTFT